LGVAGAGFISQVPLTRNQISCVATKSYLGFIAHSSLTNEAVARFPEYWGMQARWP